MGDSKRKRTDNVVWSVDNLRRELCSSSKRSRVVAHVVVKTLTGQTLILSGCDPVDDTVSSKQIFVQLEEALGVSSVAITLQFNKKIFKVDDPEFFLPAGSRVRMVSQYGGS